MIGEYTTQASDVLYDIMQKTSGTAIHRGMYETARNAKTAFTQISMPQDEATYYFPVVIERAAVRNINDAEERNTIMERLTRLFLEELSVNNGLWNEDVKQSLDTFIEATRNETRELHAFPLYLVRKTPYSFNLVINIPAPCVVNDPATGKRIPNLFCGITAFNNRRNNQINIFSSYFIKMSSEFMDNRLSEQKVRVVTIAKKILTNIKPIMVDVMMNYYDRYNRFDVDAYIPDGDILQTSMEEWERMPEVDKKKFAETYEAYMEKYVKKGCLRVSLSLFLKTNLKSADAESPEEDDSGEDVYESADTADVIREASMLRQSLSQKNATIQNLESEKMFLQKRLFAMENMQRKENERRESTTNTQQASSALDTKDAQIKKLTAELERQRFLAQHLQNKLGRPSSLCDIPKWVAEKFSDKLILLPRAEKMLSVGGQDGIDVDILCDAIEYLAEEFKAVMGGEMSSAKAFDICSIKYQRPFKVKAIGSQTQNSKKTFAEYSVDYKGGKTVMDMHLIYGNTPGSLIRIYFFYDKEERKIIVGSLPQHLSSPLTAHI